MMPEGNGNVKLLEEIKRYIDKKITIAFDSLNDRFDQMMKGFRKLSGRIDEVDIDIKTEFKDMKRDLQEIKDLINKK